MREIYQKSQATIFRHISYPLMLKLAAVDRLARN